MNKFDRVTNTNISSEFEGQRLDNYLMRILKGVPRSHVYRIIRSGEVRLNGKRCKANTRVAADDALRIPPIRLAEASNTDTSLSKGLSQQLQDAIILNDKYLLVVNKPSGIAVHGGSGINLGLIEAYRALYPEQKFLDLAHRLDRDTSGVLIICKRPRILREVHTALREQQTKKFYYALVKGIVKKKSITVDAPLQKNTLQSGERIVKVNPEGKPSKTVFSVEQTFPEFNCSLVKAQLFTGRTHQIRVHAKHIGHPVAGDEKYGDDEFNAKLKKQFKLKRLFLHANQMQLALEDYPDPLNFMAELPEVLSGILSSLS